MLASIGSTSYGFARPSASRNASRIRPSASVGRPDRMRGSVAYLPTSRLLRSGLLGRTADVVGAAVGFSIGLLLLSCHIATPATPATTTPTAATIAIHRPRFLGLCGGGGGPACHEGVCGGK